MSEVAGLIQELLHQTYPRHTPQQNRAAVLTGLKMLTTWGLKQCLREHRVGNLLLDGSILLECKR